MLIFVFVVQSLENLKLCGMGNGEGMKLTVEQLEIFEACVDFRTLRYIHRHPQCIFRRFQMTRHITMGLQRDSTERLSSTFPS